MKSYYTYEISLKKAGAPIAGGEDFGRSAAVEHRIAKASHGGAKPFGSPIKASASRFLAMGTFKKVYDTPAADDGIQNQISFVLAKLDCTDRNGRPDEEIEKAKGAVDDQVKTMILCGAPKTSLFVSFKFTHSASEERQLVTPRFYLYLPRVNGHSLKDLIGGNKGPLTKNLQILYFISLCHELEALHKAGYYHADLKPDNIMAGQTTGASLIDFGGVTRSWMPYTQTTPPYCITHEAYRDFFIERYQANRRPPTPATVQPNMFNFQTNLFPTTDMVASLEEILTSSKQYLYRELINISADQRKNAGYLRKVTSNNNRPCVFGAAYDTAALTLIALELKLWDAKTEPLFRTLIQNNFKPSFLQPIIEALTGQYTDNPVDLNRHVKLNILTPDTIQIVQPLKPGIEPSAVLDVIKARYKVSLEKNGLTPDQVTKNLSELNYNFLLFQKFKTIAEIYKQNEIDRDITKVETKFLTLTHLINMLTYTSDWDEICKILAKIFAVSLINRSIFASSKPTSFVRLFNAVKEPTIMPIIRAVYWSSFNNTTTQDQLIEYIKTNIENLFAVDVPLSKDFFKKSARYETIMSLLLEDSTQSLKPLTKSEARAAISGISLTRLTNEANENPLLNAYKSAIRTTPHSPQPSEWKSERQTIATYIQKAFNDMQAGYLDDAQRLQYQQDIADFYNP